MSRLSLGTLAVWLRLGSMDDIRELCDILNEEDGKVVAKYVPIALGVELDSKTTYIAHGVCRSTTTKNSRESHEKRSCAIRVGEDASGSNICRRLKEGVATLCTSSSLTVSEQMLD